MHFALRFKFGDGNPFGDFEDVVEHYKRDPAVIYVTARTLAAILCMVGVVAIFFVGRRLWDRRRPGGGGDPGLRVPAGGVLAGGGYRRGHAGARRAALLFAVKI